DGIGGMPSKDGLLLGRLFDGGGKRFEKALRRKQDGTGPLCGGGKDIEALAHGCPTFIVALSLCRKLIEISVTHCRLYGYRHAAASAQVVEYPCEERIT